MASGVGTTHHVKIGNEYLLVRPNTYQKRPAPTFGARITTGDPDYNNLSFWQHWVQKCWIGGLGADQWIDDAMFKDGFGLDTTQHEVARLSRTLKRGAGANWTLGGSANVAGMRFEVFGGTIYALVMTTGAFASRLYRYDSATQSWTAVTFPGTVLNARSIATFDGKMFIGGIDGATPKLYYATAPGTWTAAANPAGVTQAIYAMRQYNSKLYVAYGTQVWRMKDDHTWDGSTVFTKVNANSGSNYIQAMETHLGFLYMLSQNGHLHRTDGNNTFDIWSWDGQTAGQSLRSYDGKLFVATYEYSDDAVTGNGVLYQFTGAAVTELKRWGKIGRKTELGNLTTYGRRLYYGAPSMFGAGNGFGVACYDSAEDAHSIWAVQDDVATYPDASGFGQSWCIEDLIVFGGKLFAAVYGYGVLFTEDTYRDVEQGRAQYNTSTAGGTITSSLYDAGTPGLQKMWRKVTVYCDLPHASTSFTLSYSTDGGTTWTAQPTVTGPLTDGSPVVVPLNNVQASRFQYRITLNSTNEAYSPALRGVVVAYLPQPEPNWMWSFTVPVADVWVLLNGVEEVKSTNALIAYLEGLYRTQQLVTFTDIDNVQWALNGPGVLIYDLSVIHYDIEQPREADLRITLLEAVESY